MAQPSEPATARRREELELLIRHFFAESDGTYGHRRIHADLIDHASKLASNWSAPSCGTRAWSPASPSHGGSASPEAAAKVQRIPDLVNRDFTADAPGLKMVGEITYVETREGWIYLATVIDCHTKAVVGWAMNDNYKTPLIEKAIEMAARDHTLADQAIFQSDRGSNCTSTRFATTLKRVGLRQSVGRAGICYGNSMAELLCGTLKNGRCHRTEYPTREHAYRDIARYIEFRYNSRRRHSGLQYRTPKQVHNEYLNRQIAA